MSLFLERQSVQRRRRWVKGLRQFERVLIAALGVVVGLFALYGLYRVVFLGSVFQVQKIVVDGNWHYLSADWVARLSGIKRGDNLFWMSVGQVHERLSSEPWIKRTAVRRRLPDTLWIYVEENRPAAIAAAGCLFYVDAEGTVIKRVEGGEAKDLPVLTGLSLSESGELAEGEGERLRGMLSLLDLASHSSFIEGRGIAEIHIDAVKGYSIITRREPVEILLGTEALAERMAQLDRMSSAIAAHGGRIKYMLANEQGRMVVGYRPS
jgi:cell division protein FtsQ